MSHLTGRPRFLRPADEPVQSWRRISEQTVPSSADSIHGNSDRDSHTAFVYNRHSHLAIETQRTKLPIFSCRYHILYLLEKFQTLVLVGETGSGKSTQIPQYLLESGYCANGGSIAVTSPRVSAAVALADRVAHEQNTLCGKDGFVGYAVSFDNQYGSNTKIKYVTEGILLREMFSDPLLTQYSCIMLDEVHERNQITDVIMGLVKKILKKRKTLKLIVSSATMDAEFLRDFFNLNKRNVKNTKSDVSDSTASILSVQGRVHPVDIFYSKEPVPDYVKATIDTIIKIHETEPFGDILAFLTGQDEVISASKILIDYAADHRKKMMLQRNMNSNSGSELSVVVMYGSLPHYEQLKAFQTAPAKTRKVVIATNIAETSVTIPGIIYVIDCGFHKVRYFEASVSFDNLVTCPISKANATQRAGRAGRMSKGKCYRLYSEESFLKMSPSVAPEMQRSDLSAIVLQLKALGIDNVLRFTFPSPPSARALLSAVEELFALGAIDDRGNLTKPLGERMAETPLRPAFAKILCHDEESGCFLEILSIIAALQVDNVYVKPSGGQQSINARIAKRNNFEVAEGDLMTLLNVVDAYTKQIEVAKTSHNKKHMKEWCHKMFLNEKALIKVMDIRSSLEKLLVKKFGISNSETVLLDGAKTEKVLRRLCCGLFPRAACLKSDGSYRTLLGGSTPLHISPESCLYNAQQPQWVLFCDVQSSSDKTYMKNLVVIQKDWLTELAPHFYKES